MGVSKLASSLIALLVLGPFIVQCGSSEGAVDPKHGGSSGGSGRTSAGRVGAAGIGGADAAGAGAGGAAGGTAAGADAAGAGGTGAGEAGSAGASAGECEPGERRCTGLVPQVCDTAGRWEDAGQACPFTCEDGVCTGVCVPGAARCVSETARQTCAGDGEWGADEPCPHACVDGACAGQCIPGARRCQELQRQQCSGEGEWVDDGEPCPFACSAGACSGLCTPGERQCSSTTELQTCGDDGEWEAAVECPMACVGGQCGGVCKPGDAQCVGASPSTARSTCSSVGEWSAPFSCTYVCTGAGECGGECTPGAKRCDGARPERCDAGEWVASGPECTASETCQEETGRCESCEPFSCGEGAARVVWQLVGPPGAFVDVEIDSQGAVYAAGTLSEPTRDYFAKYDANGHLIWERMSVLTDSRGDWTRTAIDKNDTLWLVASTGYIARYSPEGDQLAFASINDGNPLNDIEVDSAGNVYVAGGLGAPADRRAMVAKYSADLVRQWVASHTPLSIAQGVAVDGAGNVFLTGRSEVSSGGVIIGSQLLIKKYDSAGALAYTKTLGDCGYGGYINARGAITDAAGDLYITGSYCSIKTALMEKWSAAGVQLWKNDVPLVTTSAGAAEVQLKSDGNAVSITASAEAWSHSPSGERLWNTMYSPQRRVSMNGFALAGPNEMIAGGSWPGPNSSVPTQRLLVKLRLPANP